MHCLTGGFRSLVQGITGRNLLGRANNCSALVAPVNDKFIMGSESTAKK